MNERGGITAVQKQLGHRNIAYSAGYCQRTDDELGLPGAEGEVGHVGAVRNRKLQQAKIGVSYCSCIQ
jgi:hypothetical protein